MPGFNAVVKALGKEPFVLRVVMDQAHGLFLCGQVEQNCPAALDELLMCWLVV